MLGAGVILLFSSRACYNLAVLFLSQNHKVEAFDYDWYNISDQVCHVYTSLSTNKCVFVTGQFVTFIVVILEG